MFLSAIVKYLGAIAVIQLAQWSNIMNVTMLTGNLGQNVETSTFSNGNTKYVISLATSGGYTDSNGIWVDQTEWHRVETIVSAKATEKLHKYYATNLVKGAKVAVNGMNRTSKWNDAQGVAQRKSYVAVEYSNGGAIEVQSSPAMNVSQDATPEQEIVTQPKPEETVPF